MRNPINQSRLKAMVLMACCMPLLAAAKPVIMTTIKPVALLSQAVVGDLAEVDVLLPKGGSPHRMSLRISDRQRLSQSDLLIWIGPNLERYLEPLAATMDSLQLSKVDGESGHQAIEEQEQELDHSPSNEQRHAHAHDVDAHFWLNPEVAQKMVLMIADRMMLVDPDHRETYQHNAQQEVDRIEAVASLHRERIGSEQSRAYGVTHDAYGHLFDYFEFPRPEVITESPEISPSVKRLWQLSKILERGSCVMVEPEYSRGWIKNLADKNQYRLMTVDLLGIQTLAVDYSQWLS